jgi:ribonuclease VapC
MTYTAVLDASALLTAFNSEPGMEIVLPLLPGSAVSAVNWSEVLQKSAAQGIEPRWLASESQQANVEIVPFTADDARGTAELWPVTKSIGLSLADRACLALAMRLGVVAVTADRAWANLPIRGPITVIR